MRLGRYVNPSDKLLRLANQPSSLSAELTHDVVYARSKSLIAATTVGVIPEIKMKNPTNLETLME